MITANDILQIARTGVSVRTWRCPACGETVSCPFDPWMLEVHIGSPHCSKCGELMLLMDNYSGSEN